MGRSKNKPSSSVRPYCTGRGGGINPKTGGSVSFFPCYDDLLKEPEILNLSNGAFRLYVDMATASKGRGMTGFTFSRGLAARYGFSETSFYRAVKELVAAGLLKVLENNRTKRTANVYAFTDDWKLKPPPPLKRKEKRA